ncbi:MAG TPA: ATP-binding protein [Candidatus Eisenbacteria bacterium]|nr:ATP-binding protein [Candidatus Eisenbacteria bacterium]
MALDFVLDASTHTPFPVAPDSFGCHTAVLAQSGSGKSFLVGRVIEELVLKSKARVVVLDPNSDFVRLPEVNETAWKDARLQQWFPPGDTVSSFKAAWATVRPIVVTNRNLPGVRPLRISWGALTDTERAAILDLDPAKRPHVYWTLLLADELARTRWDATSEADYDFEHFRKATDDVCDFLLGAEGPADVAAMPIASTLRDAGTDAALEFRTLATSMAEMDIWHAVGDDTPDIATIVTDGAGGPSVVIIDLLSVESQTARLVLTGRAIAEIWNSARRGYSEALRDIDDPDLRVPTIIVIDEAHNLVPTTRSSPAAERIASDLIRIAAEGRKFGLFLLVITQRPRKLDASILSECDGLMLMRMTNESDLRSAAELFGFLDASVARTSMNLNVGDVLLQGRLGSSATVYHVAPRRTKEGGRSLDSKHWTVPY